MADQTLERRDFYVYVLFRHDSGEPFYVGKGTGKRWRRHLRQFGSNPHRDRIVRLALAAGVEPPCVKVATALRESEAFKTERAFIRAIGRRKDGGPLTNATDGGDGSSGAVLSAETRERMSAAQKRTGNRPPVATGNKFKAGKPAWNSGKTMSDELRAKLSAAHIGKPSLKKGVALSEETKAKIRATKACATEEDRAATRAKIKAIRTGRKLSVSPEGRAAKAAAASRTWTGRRHSEATKAKISATKRAGQDRNGNDARMCD